MAALPQESFLAHLGAEVETVGDADETGRLGTGQIEAGGIGNV